MVASWVVVLSLIEDKVMVGDTTDTVSVGGNLDSVDTDKVLEVIGTELEV